MKLWEVLAEADREQWACIPSVSVGPLRFGMSHVEATAALKNFTSTVTFIHCAAGEAQKAEFRNVRVPSFSHRSAVTVYYGQPEGLFCVVSDAQYGPQVLIDGVRLVGRVPSQLEEELFEYLMARGISPQYQPEGDPAAEGLGLMMRAQRAGDVVLTRPVLAVVRERAYTLWDGMPYDELRIH